MRLRVGVHVPRAGAREANRGSGRRAVDRHGARPRGRGWICGFFLAACVSAQPGRLQREIEALENTGARVGVAAVKLPQGDLVAHHRARDVFVPASNQKLLALAAVLHGLGPDHEFVTRFHVRGGALVVEACGDPNWQTGGAHDPRAILAEVAARLRASGISAVRDVTLAADRFAGPARPESWSIYDQALAYCPPTGALVLDAGCFEAVLRVPERGGRADVDVVAPPVSFTVEGRIDVTSDRRKGSVYGLAVRDDSLRAYGALWHKAGPRHVRGAFPEADSVTLRTLRACLEAAGIEVRVDATPPDADDVWQHRSPLRLALPPMLHESSNFHAEQLARALGAARHGDGSCRGGAEAIARELRDLVGAWPDVVVDDAAGLSRENRVSPAFLVTLLTACARQPWGELFAASLPAGGEGTLERRFAAADFAVRAKTGTLRDASTLSGYVEVDGRSTAFVVFVNVGRGGRVAHAAWRSAQDRIVAAIAGL